MKIKQLLSWLAQGAYLFLIIYAFESESPYGAWVGWALFIGLFVFIIIRIWPNLMEAYNFGQSIRQIQQAKKALTSHNVPTPCSREQKIGGKNA